MFPMTHLSDVYWWIWTSPAPSPAAMKFWPTHVNVAYIILEIMPIITNRFDIMNTGPSIERDHVIILPYLIGSLNYSLPMGKYRFINPCFVVLMRSESHGRLDIRILGEYVSMDMTVLYCKCPCVFRYRIDKLRPLLVQDVVVPYQSSAILCHTYYMPLPQ